MALYLTFTLAFLSFTTFTATRMLLSLFALNLGGTPFDVGVISALFWIFPMFLSWPIGVLSDRHGARWLFALAGVAGVVALAIPGWLQSIQAAYVSAALGGLSLSVYNVVAQNLVGQLSSPEKRAGNFANFMVLGSCSSFVGPLMVGSLIDHGGFVVASRVLLAIPLLGVVLLAWRGRLLPAGSGQSRPRGSLSGMLTGPGMQRTLLLSAVVTLTSDLFQFYIPVYGHQQGLTASAIGMVSAANSAASFVSRLSLQRLLNALGEPRLLMIMMFAGGVAYALAPFTGGALELGVVAALFGFSMGCGQPLTVLLVYALSEAGRAGETLGVRLTVNNMVRVVGPLAFGAVATAFGMLPVFLLNAVMLGGSGLAARPGKTEAAGPS